MEDYFPRIESIYDNFGNSWLPSMGKNVFTKFTLSPDDSVEFIIKAIDPGDLPIKYYCSLFSELIESNKFSIKIKEGDIGINTPISLGIRSDRSYRKIKGNEIDEWATFYYNIVPKHSG